MKNELAKLFAKKMIRKIVIFVIIMIIVSAIGQSMGPIISNQIALGQMQNSDEMHIFMNTYTKIRSMFNAIYIGVILWFMYTIGRDTYKFVKSNYIENEKEN